MPTDSVDFEGIYRTIEKLALQCEPLLLNDNTGFAGRAKQVIGEEISENIKKISSSVQVFELIRDANQGLTFFAGNIKETRALLLKQKKENS